MVMHRWVVRLDPIFTSDMQENAGILSIFYYELTCVIHVNCMTLLVHSNRLQIKQQYST